MSDLALTPASALARHSQVVIREIRAQDVNAFENADFVNERKAT